MHWCLLFLPIPIPIHGDCSIPIPIPNTRYGYTIIPIPNTRYDTDSYRLFIDITLNNRLISPIPISPIPIPILGDCFIPIPIPVLISIYRLMPGIGRTLSNYMKTNARGRLVGHRPRVSQAGCYHIHKVYPNLAKYR